MLNARMTTADLRPPRARRAPRDRVAVVLVAMFVALGVVVGLRTGTGVADVDEAAFRQTLTQMRHGDGYYLALHDALVIKEGKAPSSPRAYRLPTEFLVLAHVPDRGLRWAVAVPFAVMLVAAWRLGRPYGEWGGTVSTVLVGFWVVGAAPYLYLHAEIWGGALFLAALALARRRPRPAAAAFAGAVLVRELFGLGFLIGLVRNRRSMAWWLAAAVVVVVGAVHLRLAGQYLDPDGYQPPLRFSGSYLEAISPGNGPFGAIVGIVGGLAGIVGCALAVRARDEAARIAIAHNVALAVITVLFGRTYWVYTWGPSTAVFAAATLDRALDRQPR